MGKAIDYSQKSCWYKLPQITQEFDTFYIYSTIYMGANEGDPDNVTIWGESAGARCGCNLPRPVSRQKSGHSTTSRTRG